MTVGTHAPAPSGTWGIAPVVRRALAKSILELRAAVEDDFRKQFGAVGIRPAGALSAGRPLDPHEQRARDLGLGLIERDVKAGSTFADALEGYVRESAFTLLNRLVGLRCLDERGMLIVDGQQETAVKLDPARGSSSLYWRVRNELPPTSSPREVWRETLRRAGAAISELIRVLFDPEAEHAVLLPLLPTLQKVVDALNSIDVPAETWAEDEVLGWVYQYYNTLEKDAVYARLARGTKLERPEELAAATTLYTERYMVDYLLQNTLGALWVEMHPETRLPERWPYYVTPPEGNEKVVRPVRPLREITLIDPACGSGHFLVRAFDLLVEMYREEGRESEPEIPQLILERNLHGIDIDARAVQIAAFGLYLKACVVAGPDFRPNRINLVAADAVLPGEEPPAEYLARMKDDPDAQALVKSIWQGLRNVREFGSLLHPERAIDEVVQRRRQREQGQLWAQDEEAWGRWKQELLAGLRHEFEQQAQSEDLGQRLFGEEAAKGVSLVEALGRKYDVVVMNPPYAGSKNLGDRLKKFLEREYKDGKRDLYVAFIERCRDFTCHDGLVGMVTQQSWLFLRSYAAMRKETLERTGLTTLAHLGTRAFEEIGGEVVNIALYTLRTTARPGHQRMTALRLVGQKTPAEKDALLRRAVSGQSPSVVFTPRQVDFLPIPETPIVYWLRPRFFELLQSTRRLRSVADVRQGLATADDERFTRCFWEVSSFGVVRAGAPLAGRWFWFAKGGRYQKWAGLEWLVVNWEGRGREIYDFNGIPFGSAGAPIRNPGFYFRAGLTYTPIARGSFGVRTLDDAVFGHKGSFILPTGTDWRLLSSLLNARVVSYLMRTISQTLGFEVSHVRASPLPDACPPELQVIAQNATNLKRQLVRLDPLERSFSPDTLTPSVGAQTSANGSANATEALLLTLEGVNERLVTSAYSLGEEDVQAILDETGTPAGWYPLVSGYDALPEHITQEFDLAACMAGHERRTLQPHTLERLKAHLRTLYTAGRGIRTDKVDERSDVGDEPADGEPVEFGARVPLPSENFLEELSQTLEIHPVSVYRLLEELRKQDDLVSPPEVRRYLEKYVSISLLLLLGYRWPEQEGYASHHTIIPSTMLDDDGIIPLVTCGNQTAAAVRLREHLERKVGEQVADQSEGEFRQWVGRSIEEWLRRDFFKFHVQHFKQRPIAWHLISPERTFEAFVLYKHLSRATLQKLRSTYAGGLISRLAAEQDRARQADKTAEVSRLQLQIEDVEEFRSRLEKIERGDELKYRIRCRWKGEEETGRPGPYAPDIDDGVKVNIRPFQEAGLLAVKEVIKKW